KKKVSGLFGFVQDRFLSLAMVLGIGFLLLVTLVFDAMISAIGDRLVPGGEVVLQFFELAFSLALATVLFAAIFRVLPDLKIAWHDVWLGAAITAVLFVAGKFALGLYIGKAAVGSSYGAAGSLVVLLVWVYWSTQILLFGAEFTQVYARTTHPVRAPVPEPVRVPVPAPVHESVRVKPGGGKKLALGGLAGLLLGTLLGGITAMIVAIKSLKKLALAPLKLIR
ncbi:MAG TPA: YihY/virulence factor BrkB family protein, partial [Thermoanaerobaculia bacterium]|nr:YihY/virulence factor BrkB family protein [Thermoanaerobaculia bacterium]